MKKNNTYLTDDEINLGNVTKLLWTEKILISSISIICGLLGYLYASFKPQVLKIEITIQKPPAELFELYNPTFNNNNNNNNINERFMSYFKVNFLSLDNLESFLEESRDFDNFKRYLESKNIFVKNYFVDKIGEVKEKNLIIPNKYFLVFTKELDGVIFLNNYLKFIKKKTVFEVNKILELSIINKITNTERALEYAKFINLENPILRSMNEISQVVNDPEALFYKGSKILSQEIIYLKKLLTKLENEQFNYEIKKDKPFIYSDKKKTLDYFVAGLILGLCLSLGIIFFKSSLKNN
jgi:LPS O-antigen subunit length determinant protein (WzzB/FepE family)